MLDRNLVKLARTYLMMSRSMDLEDRIAYLNKAKEALKSFSIEAKLNKTNPKLFKRINKLSA